MGDELCCSRQNEMSFDFNYLKPEQNINIKEESNDEQDELNIIEHIKSKENNIINQANTNSVIIQNDEFMYERIETKKEIKQNNFFYNMNDEEGPQDSVIKNDKENKEKNEENNNLTDNIMDSDFPQDSNVINNICDSNKINENNIEKKNNTNNENNDDNNFVIDSNKINIFYQSQETNDNNNDNYINNDKEEENEIKNENIIQDNNNDKEINQPNLEYINSEIQNNKEEIIENQIQDIIINNNSKVTNYDYNNEYLIENENKSSQINNNYEEQIDIENNKIIENNINYTPQQNNELYQTNNNINYEIINKEKNTDIDLNQIQIEYIFENNNNTSQSNNNILNEININENPTFFPKNNNTSNNINTNTNYNIEYTSNNTNNTYENIEQLYQTSNNIIESDYNKKPEVNIITNNNYQENNIKAYKPTNINNVNNNYNYLYNIESSNKPLFTDKEIDDLIKQAEQSHYYKNLPITYKTISEYPKKINKQQKTKVKNYNYYPYLNQEYYNNLILTPEKKKNYYLLTPDNKTKKYSKFLNNKNNVNYNLITNPQKTTTTNNYGQYINSNYNYNNYNIINYDTPTKTKKNNEYILYSSPSKENTNINYIYNPQKKLQNKNSNTQLINNIKPLKYSIISNTSNTSKYTNNNIQVNTNIYQPKKIIQNNSIINQSYLKSIQQSNQFNNNKKYVVNTLSSDYSNNNLNSSFSSSESPKKYDKYGNPIYFKSLRETNNKLKEYQNSEILRRKNFHKIKSFSFDDIRNKNFNDDISNNDLSSYESPISSPKNNQRKNLDLNSMNSTSSLNSLKNKKINMKQSNLYQNQSQINPALSILTSTIENNFLDIDEQTKQIINRYITTDISSTSNFFPDNYKLFYPSNNEYFSIPQSIIKKQIKYYINNDPSKIAIYTGGINEINKRHGLGQLKENNCIKIGTWKNDIFSGWGRIIYNNSQVFEGKYENGKLNGKGVYKYKDNLYVGDFINNIREGKGVLINNRFRYKGQFNEGKINGYGKIVFLENKEGNGEYEGFFKDNNIEGKGIMKWKNGNIYEGEMKNGKMNGYGKFIPKGGFPTEGVFRNNVRVNVKK